MQTDLERSNGPLDALLRIGGAIYEESLKHGDLPKANLLQGLQDFLNKARMGNKHFDHDILSHDLYYSTPYLVEEYASNLDALERICREVVSHVITTAPAPDISSQPKPNDRSESSEYNAAKACFYYFMALNTAAQESEDKRMKALERQRPGFKRSRKRLHKLRKGLFRKLSTVTAFRRLNHFSNDICTTVRSKQ